MGSNWNLAYPVFFRSDCAKKSETTLHSLDLQTCILVCEASHIPHNQTQIVFKGELFWDVWGTIYTRPYHSKNLTHGPITLPAKSPGKSIQPCNHPQLRLSSVSKVFKSLCHRQMVGAPDLSFSDLAKFGNIEEHVCRFCGISLQSEDNNQITIEGNTAWAISEALGPRPSLGGECQ